MPDAELDRPQTRGLSRLIEIVRRLRGENGCPWDREQTLESLKPHVIEESYELVDAIDSGDADRHQEELGDVLLQVALQSQIQAESGKFALDDVADRLATKLIRRHPHVFGNVQVADTDDVLRNWETIKAREKEGTETRSALAGVPRHLPALQKAQRVQSRVARVGFDWPEITPVIAKVDEELAEIREAMARGNSADVKAEIGDLLFAIVNLCRFVDVQAEEAIQEAVAKFAGRFAEVERRIQQEGRQLSECSLAEMDAHWDAIKREEARG